MAHKKGVGSTKNGRDSESKRPGVKRATVNLFGRQHPGPSARHPHPSGEGRPVPAAMTPLLALVDGRVHLSALADRKRCNGRQQKNCSGAAYFGSPVSCNHYF